MTNNKTMNSKIIPIAVVLTAIIACALTLFGFIVIPIALYVIHTSLLALMIKSSGFKKSIIAVVVSLLAATACAVLFADIVPVVFQIISAISGSVIALLVEKNQNRLIITTVDAVLIFALVCSVLFVGLTSYFKCGITDAIDKAFLTVENGMNDIFEQTLSNPAFSESGITVGDYKSLNSYLIAQARLNIVGILFASCFVISYLSTVIYKFFSKKFSIEIPVVNSVKWLLITSKVFGFIFMLSALITFIFGGKFESIGEIKGTWSIVCIAFMNIFIIFGSYLFFEGVFVLRNLLSLLKSKKPKLVTFAIIAVVLCGVIDLEFLILVIAYLGTFMPKTVYIVGKGGDSNTDEES